MPKILVARPVPRTKKLFHPYKRPSLHIEEQNEMRKQLKPPLQNQDDYMPTLRGVFLLTTLCVVIFLTWRMFGLLG
ncbi:hypothetical protein L218DRAFT_968106, partial [Marasmius fiardii PR-910]